MGEVTGLLQQACAGDTAAQARLLDRLYADLERMARGRLRASGDLTLLDARALVHEFYLRLQSAGELRFEDRAHFLAYAARVMRSIVVDVVRARGAARRGGGRRPLTLSTDLAGALGDPDATAQAVHEALAALESVDARLARIVEMRFFGGFAEEEVAAALGVGVRTVQREWRKARMLLAGFLQPL